MGGLRGSFVCVADCSLCLWVCRFATPRAPLGVALSGLRGWSCLRPLWCVFLFLLPPWVRWFAPPRAPVGGGPPGPACGVRAVGLLVLRVPCVRAFVTPLRAWVAVLLAAWCASFSFSILPPWVRAFAFTLPPPVGGLCEVGRSRPWCFFRPGWVAFWFVGFGSVVLCGWSFFFFFFCCFCVCPFVWLSALLCLLLLAGLVGGLFSSRICLTHF